jgi:hypothetical protein
MYNATLRTFNRRADLVCASSMNRPSFRSSLRIQLASNYEKKKVFSTFIIIKENTVEFFSLIHHVSENEMQHAVIAKLRV